MDHAGLGEKKFHGREIHTKQTSCICMSCSC